MTNEGLLEKLKWRCALKRIDSFRNISQTNWQTFKEALILNPLNSELKPWKFYFVTVEKLNNKLQLPSKKQLQMVEGAHLVVIESTKNSNPETIENNYKRISEVKGILGRGLVFFKQNAWILQQETFIKIKLNESEIPHSFFAFGLILTLIEVLGFEAFPMEGFDQDGFNQFLGIEKDEFNSVMIFALGYCSKVEWKSKLPKVRFEKMNLLNIFEN